MRIRLIMLLLVALVGASCAPVPQLINQDWLDDRSLISGDPCEAPCWQGIIPGETSWEAVLPILEADDRFTNLNDDSPLEPTTQVIFNSGEGPQCCLVLARDGETVSLILTFIAPQILFGDVIDKFGEPAYIDGREFSEAQTEITAIYPDVPMIVYIHGGAFDSAQLERTNSVFGALYMTDDEMDELLQSENLYEWRGFGDVSEMFDGQFDVTAVPTAEGSNP